CVAPGHNAVETTITESKLAMCTRHHLEGKPVAFLRQRTFIVVREPVKRFTPRAFPFRTAEFKTLRSPNLIAPKSGDIISLASGGATTYWPRYEEADGTIKAVQFLVEGPDWNGELTS